MSCTTRTARSVSVPNFCYPEQVEKPPVVRITVDGKLALTLKQVADRYGIPQPGLRRDLSREADAPKPIEPPPIDERTPAYWFQEIDRFIKRERPGRGAPGKPRALPKRKPAAQSE